MSVREFRNNVAANDAAQSYIKSEEKLKKERLALVETMIAVYASHDMRWYHLFVSVLLNICITCFIVVIVTSHIVPVVFGLGSILVLIVALTASGDEYHRHRNRYYQMPIDAFVCSCAYKLENGKKD